MTTTGYSLDLVTHSEVDIPARAAVLWPLIVNPNDWKQGLHLEDDSGPSNEVGQRRVGRGPDGSVLLIVDTAAVDPERRMVVKLTTASGVGDGWASWALHEHESGTVVSYDVYASMRSVEGISDAEYIAMNQQRFDAELLGLRDLVLATGRGPSAA